jgi:hypothetical protein
MKIKSPAGTFEVPEEFTLREMRTIRDVSGLLPGQIEDALENGDTGIITALVVVAANRSGKLVTEDQVLDWKLSDLEFLGDEDEDEEEAPAKGRKKKDADPT